MQRLPLPHLLFAFAAALLPGAVAIGAATFHADVVATSLHATNSIRLEGPMGAFLQEQLASDHGGANADFRLEAALLRVETDTADPMVHAVIDVGGESVTTTTVENYTAAMVVGTANQESYRWHVFGIDSANPPLLSVSASCADAQPSVTSSLVRTPYVNVDKRAPVEIQAADLLQWGCMEGGTATVKGDFRLSLWAWNATLTAPGTTKEIHSGHEQFSRAPAGAPDVSKVASRDSEVYIFARNATLTVPVLTGRGYTLLTGLGTALSATDVSLEGAAGHLALPGHEMNLQSSAMSVKGQTAATLSGADVNKPFNVQLQGSPDAVTLDGRAVALPTAAPTAWASWPLLPWAVGLVLAPLVLLGVGRGAALVMYQIHASLAGPARGVRHRVALGYSLLSTFQVDAGRLHTARFLAWRAIRALPTSAEGYLAHAEATRRLRAHRAALRDHRALDDLLADGRQRAINACNAAATLCQLGRPGEAVEWLQTADSQDPGLAAQQAARPEFDALGDDPFLRSLRLRAHGDSSYIQ